MYDTLERYLQVSGKHPKEVGEEIGKTRQCILQWLEKGGFTMDYDGRSFAINWINAPERRVYDRNQLSFDFDSAPGE